MALNLGWILHADGRALHTADRGQVLIQPRHLHQQLIRDEKYHKYADQFKSPFFHSVRQFAIQPYTAMRCMVSFQG